MLVAPVLIVSLTHFLLHFLYLVIIQVNDLLLTLKACLDQGQTVDFSSNKPCHLTITSLSPPSTAMSLHDWHTNDLSKPCVAWPGPFSVASTDPLAGLG